jgi:transcriptional regulator with XRE-family HTH domain
MPRLSVTQGRPSTAELGRRIRAERERLGMTQVEAARRLRISRGSYRQIETVTVLQYGVLLALVLDLGMDAKVLAPELTDHFSSGSGLASISPL